MEFSGIERWFWRDRDDLSTRRLTVEARGHTKEAAAMRNHIEGSNLPIHTPSLDRCRERWPEWFERVVRIRIGRCASMYISADGQDLGLWR